MLDRLPQGGVEVQPREGEVVPFEKPEVRADWPIRYAQIAETVLQEQRRAENRAALVEHFRLTRLMMLETRDFGRTDYNNPISLRSPAHWRNRLGVQLALGSAVTVAALAQTVFGNRPKASFRPLFVEETCSVSLDAVDVKSQPGDGMNDLLVRSGRLGLTNIDQRCWRAAGGAVVVLASMDNRPLNDIHYLPMDTRKEDPVVMPNRLYDVPVKATFRG